MREILFRGKRTDNDEWVYGYYYAVSRDRHPASLEQKKAFIKHETWDEGFDNFGVEPETIGQYTGLTDKNGTKIFEGDILRNLDGEMSVIEFNRYGWDWGVGLTGFVAVRIYDWGLDNSMQQEGKVLFREANRNFYSEETEIVGNVWENPELLKER